ncbi:MAG: peptidyl-prolyl cis-trans isomerase [Desulfuromonadales bacterium]|nr:peptidyl-prolyl cis-trans isomerase [Desulfuromonadales bacterium]NIR33172.1 peptidyl-prolyl cis-trans isomerase [Desulfuromonadales bacterium]NIS39396.1 peptidyl-prolyl cis-trans isomerase [Desulfuromonadales bacterium]
MKRILLAAALLTACALPAQAAEKVVMETNMGEITLELYDEKAPVSVENFLRYVEEDYYAGTVFHRVIAGFMIQGGGFDTELKKKPTHEGITNEADNGLKNKRGTIAMARTRDVNSATAQFFINLVDNDFLDFRNRTARGYGYAVFGKVIDGMDVVDKIAAVPTRRRNALFKNLPEKQVIIEEVRTIKE